MSESSNGEWKQHVDEQGNPYYYNTVTGEYAWELPSMIQTIATGTSSWYQRSDSDGNVYYENATTGEASWELPQGSTIVLEAAVLTNMAQDTTGDFLKVDESKSLQSMKLAWEGKLKRIDPHVQEKLMQAREKQRQLQADRDQSVHAGEEYWVEMFDPGRGSFYYYGSYSGEITTEKPPSYVMGADDGLMCAVVKIQCAYRSRLARRKASQQKQKESKDSNANKASKITKSQWYAAQENGQTFYYNQLTGECCPEASMDILRFEVSKEEPPASLVKAIEKAVKKQIRHLSQDVHDALKRAKQLHEQQKVESKGTEQAEVWVEMYDPRSQSFYYFDKASKESRVDKPESYIIAAEDDLMIAVIKIQCAYRSRIARKRVREKRLSAEERLALAETRVREKVQKKKEEKTKVQKENQQKIEVKERRNMLEEEKLQCSHGDKFWGVDMYVREVLHQRSEEKAMMKAEEIQRKLEELAKKRLALDRRMSAEYRQAQLTEDSRREVNERSSMLLQEKEQCVLDKFWGLLKEAKDRDRDIQQMILEDKRSLKYARALFEHQLHERWATESSQELEEAARQQRVFEMCCQKQYLKLFEKSRSSSTVINYRWHSQKKVLTQSKDLLHATIKTNQISYNLDTVYDPDRFLHPHHVFHQMNASHTSGRKGKIDITLRKDFFHIDNSNSMNQPPLVVKVKSFGSTSSAFDPRRRAKQKGIPVNLNHSESMDLLLAKKRKHGQLPSLKSVKGSDRTSQPMSKQLHSLPSSVSNQEAHVNEERRDEVDWMTFDKERLILQQIFESMDIDKSGSIDVDEMKWALSRDKNVLKLARDSSIMSEVLKQRSVDTLFEEMNPDGSNTATWEVFIKYCEKRYYSWVARETNRRQKRKETSQRLMLEEKMKRKEEKERKGILAQEEETASLVFSLVDVDGNGTIDREEMMNALKNNDKVYEFVSKSVSLRPLLGNDTFEEAFLAMDTDEKEGVSREEFILFCSELASVALLNHL